MATKHDEMTIANVILDFKNGLCVESICDKYNVSNDTVTRWLRKVGIYRFNINWEYIKQELKNSGHLD